ncbi:XVIPCD domain-containing protein [Xanthomonas sp. LMC-A-07]|uniref:XVIPCD domain-containing protein n=1 Tax=Xanthomonas sp. LMC-A-07 TaxID=3040329 RepID=UPI00255313CE|nr:XVIPCD domain-containing protein [Xanthomonas sp. LMC-A-07]MEB2232093.1 XVIPCD domain-containing protein [Xanthomonas campestris pv. campestris]
MADLKQMLDTFEAAHATEGRALRQMLDNTPELKAQVQQAIDQKQLSGFAPSEKEGNGYFSPRTGQIGLPMDVLRSARMDVPRDDSANTARMVLGHEIGHALNKAAIQTSDRTFENKIAEVARSPSPHDYTALIKAHVAEDRTREAKDEIAGINTLAGHIKRSTPNATLGDLYEASREMASYIDKQGVAPHAVYTAKEGLRFGNDLKIDPAVPSNVEAMGKLFYDARGYPQQYGARDLVAAAEAEAAAQRADPTRAQPDVHVDLKAIGILEKDAAASLFGSGFRDTSATPPDAKRAAEPSEANRALHGKLRRGVAEAEQALGKDWDDNSERMTASLTLLAKQNGFTDRDQLSVGFNRATAAHQSGELAFVYRDGPTASPDPHANRAHMTTQEAIARPAQDTYQQLQEQNAQHAHTQRTVQAEQPDHAQAQTPSPQVLTR